MRMDQYVGLNDWAAREVGKTVKVREVGATIYPDGKARPFNRMVKRYVARRKVVGKIEGAWNPHVANLHRYTFPGGKVLEEYVQEVPWSGGPCYFIALKDGDGRPVPESLWSEEELANA